jgi:hypothetical protein
MSQPAALGFRAHSGWTAAVAVAGTAREPIVLERRRLEIADPSLPGSRQPYHAAEPLGLEAAEALLARCRESSTALAAEGVASMLAQLGERGYRALVAGILLGAGRPLPELAATLRSHALIHTAEGEFFREAVRAASERCSLAVIGIREREVWERGAAAVGLAADDLRRRIDALGRTLGPPWTQDEKLAALAGWTALAEAAVRGKARHARG